MKHKVRFFLVLFVLFIGVAPFFIPFTTSGTLSEHEAVLQVEGLTQKYFTALNHEIHYETAGDKNSSNVIILLHGFGASSFSFQKVMQDLSQDSFVVAYDRAAFGFTERPLQWQGLNPYSFEGQLAVLKSVVTRFGTNKNVTLVGHSAGGTLALEYTLQYPSEIQELVLIAPALAGDGPYPSWLQPLFSLPQIHHLGPILVSSIATSGLSILYDSYFDETKITAATLNGYTAPLKIRNWERAFWEFAKAPRYETSQITSLVTRTLIITGDSDVIVPTRASIENANKVPEVSELVVMKNTGHLPHEENPVEFVSHVLAFLRGNP